MPSSKSSPSARQAGHTLGLTPSEVRLLLLAHLCMDEATGKVQAEKLAVRASLTVSSARTMYRAARAKLARLNPEPEASAGSPDDAGASSDGTPARPRRGRPRKSEVSNAAATTEPQASED